MAEAVRRSAEWSLGRESRLRAILRMSLDPDSELRRPARKRRFGMEEPQKARFIFIAIVPFVFSDTVKAMSIVPDRYIETAQTLGASRLQISESSSAPEPRGEAEKFTISLSLAEMVFARNQPASHSTQTPGRTRRLQCSLKGVLSPQVQPISNIKQTV